MTGSDGKHLFGRREIPYSDHSIPTARGDPLTVWAKCDSMYVTCVSLKTAHLPRVTCVPYQPTHLLAIGSFPNGDQPLFPTESEQLAVRAEGNAVFLRKDRELLAGHPVPDSGCAVVEVHGRDVPGVWAKDGPRVVARVAAEVRCPRRRIAAATTRLKNAYLMILRMWTPFLGLVNRSFGRTPVTSQTGLPSSRRLEARSGSRRGRRRRILLGGLPVGCSAGGRGDFEAPGSSPDDRRGPGSRSLRR